MLDAVCLQNNNIPEINIIGMYFMHAELNV